MGWDDPYISGMFQCFGCSSAAPFMNRAPTPSMAARALVPVTLGYFMGDLALLSQWSLTKSNAIENCLMLFHHVASLIVWPAAVYFDWVSRYVLVMLTYEFTSFFLVVIWMLSAAELKKSLMYKLSGLIFTVSFVLLRMVGAIPQLIALWHATPWSREVEFSAEPGGIHGLCWIYSLSIIAPHILNLFWGVKVVKGFIGVLLGEKSKKDGTEKAA